MSDYERDVIHKVCTGMEWLDSVHPGWERRIDLGRLDMADPGACICGQLAAAPSCAWGFHLVARVVVTWLGDELTASGWLGDHGFYAPDDFWRDAIKERFDSGNLSDVEG